MTETQSEEWDSRVLITVHGRSYWVSPKTQEQMLLEDLALSETLVKLHVSHDLLEAGSDRE